MTVPPFFVEIDADPSACESIRHLLRSAPMSPEAHSSCEKALHAVLPCEPGCSFEPAAIHDVSRSKRSVLVLLGGSLVVFALIALGVLANHGEDFVRLPFAIVLPASQTGVAGTPAGRIV